MIRNLFAFCCSYRGAQRILSALAIALLSACASDVPEGIRTSPPSAVSPAEARADAQRLLGVSVRWGGIIAKVENGRDQTVLEVVARPLDRDGSPLQTDNAQLGRFLARVPGFLDPAVYEAGRELTVRGRFQGVETRNIGEYPYRYPVVQVEQHFLWQPEPQPRVRDYDPFWYDPWYPFPWWHRSPYPYYW